MKNQGNITCPKCGHQFELSEALTGQIRDDVKSQLQQEITRREVEVKKKVDELQQQRESLSKAMEDMDEAVEARLKEKLAEAEKKASRKIEQKYSDKLKELQETLGEREKSIKTFREQEIDLRKKQRELQEGKEALELDVQRRMDEERDKLRKELGQKIDEERRLKDKEKDKVISDLRTSLEDMKRKAEQGSMETQGEVLELDLEERLPRAFPYDDFDPVKKGTRGADIKHMVTDEAGRSCGMLLWETKNARNWGADWITKLKGDMREAGATIGILASVCLPSGVARFGEVEGVWVTDIASAIPLATALREQLVVLERERTASTGKGEKVEMIYRYLSGPEFRQRVEGIVDAFTDMQAQLTAERAAMERHWSKRQKQIERVITNTTGLYGDMQGIIGGLPSVPALELETEEQRQLPEGYVADPDPDKD